MQTNQTCNLNMQPRQQSNASKPKYAINAGRAGEQPTHPITEDGQLNGMFPDRFAHLSEHSWVSACRHIWEFEVLDDACKSISQLVFWVYVHMGQHGRTQKTRPALAFAENIT